MEAGRFDADELLREAQERFRSSQSADARTEVEQEIDIEHEIAEIRRYDLQGMSRVAAIEPWGRSGSILLASYFDGHEDVLSLPALRSNYIYPFYGAYPAMPLRDKLISYPLYDEYYDPQSEAAGCGRSLFDGPFALDRGRYLRAVRALCAVYDVLPPEFARSRRAFFIAVHVVCNRALGRRPETATPLIVCAQHEWDNARALQLAEDFSDARFIHTVRDPISSFDRLFDWFFDATLLPDRQPEGDARPGRYISVLAPWMVVRHLAGSDRPHTGMERRTRTVRFEDMHARTAQTMRELAVWLGLSDDSVLTKSTFGGQPYVVTRDGKTWSGARAERPRREARNLSRADRALVYALFYRDFVAWAYPYPSVFDHRLVRVAAIAFGMWVPTKMEAIVAAAAWRRRVWPWLKRGRWQVPADTLARMAFCRGAIMWLIAREIGHRLSPRKRRAGLEFGSDTPFGAS